MAVEWPGFLCLFLEEDRVSAAFELVKKSGYVFPWESEKAKAKAKAKTKQNQSKTNKQIKKTKTTVSAQFRTGNLNTCEASRIATTVRKHYKTPHFTIQGRHCVPAKVPPRSSRSTLRERIARNATKVEIKTVEKGRRDPGLGKE